MKIEIEHENLGKVIWELPASLVSDLEQASKESSEIILSDMKDILLGFCHLLLGALNSGEQAYTMVNLIRDTLFELATKGALLIQSGNN